MELDHDERVAYKLTNQEKEVVGLISMEHRFDHVFVSIIERQEKFQGQGITAYLFTIASLWSNSFGYDSGFSFESKTPLIPLYQKLGAILTRRQYMVLNHTQAEKLVHKCLNDMDLSKSNL